MFTRALGRGLRSCQQRQLVHAPKFVSVRHFGDMNSDIERVIARDRFSTAVSQMGKEPFPNAMTGHPPDCGPFGTVHNPVRVPSHEDHRIVGCVGGFVDFDDGGEREDRRHDLVWFSVSPGNLHMCSQCGQIFQIDDTKYYIEEPEGYMEADHVDEMITEWIDQGKPCPKTGKQIADLDEEEYNDFRNYVTEQTDEKDMKENALNAAVIIKGVSENNTDPKFLEALSWFTDDQLVGLQVIGHFTESELEHVRAFKKSHNIEDVQEADIRNRYSQSSSA